ncbi:8558_t:CDS:1 [Entrophospora sp. SA101]|nr:10291_t:CDS:1 [Entrophospora sp. SA101]CAJ0832151.1 3173_t:CDS:1 [Entrophospora sp. SA101]CAJ0847031.1 8558_t:CDS:1 [Entrophospora sp. SA101]
MDNNNNNNDSKILRKIKVSSKKIENKNELEKHYCEQFKKIAEYLINDVILYLPKNKKYQIIELEFYFNTLENNSNDNALLHCDPYSHQHEHQKTSGEWYFHRVGKFGYRGGTRKGIDITFGNENAYGGILIRSIKRIIDNEDDDENELIEGPSLIVDEILRLCGVDNLSIKEMVEVKWKGKSGICKDFKNFNGMIWLEEMKYTKNVDDSDGDGNNDDGGDDDGGRSEEKIRNFNKRAKYSTGVSSPYFIKSSSQSSMKHKRKSNNLKHKEIVYNSPRVGLTLSNTNPSPNLRLNFLLKPYRFFIKPHLIKKGKAQLIIGLYDRYQDINKVAEISGTSRSIVENYLKEFKLDSDNIDEFLGKKGKGSNGMEYCKMAGVVRNWLNNRDNKDVRIF